MAGTDSGIDYDIRCLCVHSLGGDFQLSEYSDEGGY